jgi:hypothetical protein
MLEQQGYYYHPTYYSFPLGHPQLDFELLAQPGGRSFDLKLAHVPIWENNNLKYETLSHRVRQPNKLQVFPGRFSLQAFDGQALNGFSFGGILQLIHFPDFTRCRLISPAPIGDLNYNPESPQFIIISALAALIAKGRAEVKNDELLAYKLAKVDPFQLFVASLMTLDKRIKKVVAVQPQLYRQLDNMIGEAIQAVKEAGKWLDSVPDLEELLSSSRENEGISYA